MRRKYLKTDLARDLGLSRSAITKLAHRGMPVHSRAAAEAWRRDNLIPARRKEIPTPARAASSAPVPALPVSTMPAAVEDSSPPAAMDMAGARLRHEMADAQRAELELRARAGSLVELAAAQAETSRVLRQIRDRLLGAAARISPQVPGDDAHRNIVYGLIDIEIKSALRQVAGELLRTARERAKLSPADLERDDLELAAHDRADLLHNDPMEATSGN